MAALPIVLLGFNTSVSRFVPAGDFRQRGLLLRCSSGNRHAQNLAIAKKLARVLNLSITLKP